MDDGDDFIPDVLLEDLEPLDKVPRGDKMALIKFDGTAITEQGNVVKHNWFKGLEINGGAYTDLVLTPEEARGLRTAHQRMKTGASAQTVLTCYGSICPRARTCPYLALQEKLDNSGEARRVVPLGKPCPIEQDILFNAVQKLSAEFDITDKDDEYTDQRLILELGEIEVLESRINDKISGDPELQGLTEEKLTSTQRTSSGDTIDNYVKYVADLMLIKERLWARKDRIRKELVGTRREKRVMSAREGSDVVDASVYMSEVMTRIRQLQAQVREKD